MSVIVAKAPKTKNKSKTTLKVAYNPKYTIAEYGFDTTRKAKWIADELENEAVPNTELLDPAAFINRAKELISEIHSQDYVQALITGSPSILATSQGFSWDKGIWEMALNSWKMLYSDNGSNFDKLVSIDESDTAAQILLSFGLAILNRSIDALLMSIFVPFQPFLKRK